MRFRNLISASALLALLAAPALAQVPSIPNAPYNVPMVNPTANTPVANFIIKNTLATATGGSPAGTYTSSILNNLAYEGINCVYSQSASSGSPKVQIAVDAYDAASATYVQFGIVPAVAASSAVPAGLQIYPGIAVSSLPTGYVGVNLHLPRWFRVRELVTDAGSTSAALSGTLSCDLLK